MNDINIDNCPDFDDSDFEPILEWAKAKVVWSDEFVDVNGNSHSYPEMANWVLVWEPGVIGFCSIKRNIETDEIKAKCAAALFIYLWCKGVEASVASHSAEAYVNYYKI